MNGPTGLVIGNDIATDGDAALVSVKAADRAVEHDVGAPRRRQVGRAVATGAPSMWLRRRMRRDVRARLLAAIAAGTEHDSEPLAGLNQQPESVYVGTGEEP
jgi:hypothetical protein